MDVRGQKQLKAWLIFHVDTGRNYLFDDSARRDNDSLQQCAGSVPLPSLCRLIKTLDASPLLAYPSPGVVHAYNFSSPRSNFIYTGFRPQRNDYQEESSQKSTARILVPCSGDCSKCSRKMPVCHLRGCTPQPGECRGTQSATAEHPCRRSVRTYQV